mgnify:CR=1 FL=1
MVFEEKLNDRMSSGLFCFIVTLTLSFIHYEHSDIKRGFLELKVVCGK